MKWKRICTVLSVFLFVAVSLAASVAVQSPVPGTWANKQALVLSITDDDEVFYSVNGADPLVSGFAYDNPVLIDVTGTVEIRIVAVSPDNSRIEQHVSYTVTEPSKVGLEGSVANFLEKITSIPVYEYKPGSVISIPSALKYSIGDGENVFLNGTDISMASDSALVRYIPCVLTDGVSYWRWMIHTDQTFGLCSRRDVPFTITDWTSVSFTDPKFIYSIDGGWWFSRAKPVRLDRSVSHVIRWQSVLYAPENPIQSFTLPPKPELRKLIRENGSIQFFTEGNPSYRIGSDGGFVAPGLFSSITFDTFPGDSVDGNLKLAIYSDNVYQGILWADYRIDKRPPAAPVIIPSVSTFLSRGPVSLRISAEDGAHLFYSLSSPRTLTGGFGDFSGTLYSSVSAGNYSRLSGNEISLTNSSEDAVFQKVFVYAQDASGNKSVPVSYGVVIDPCNYYFDASSDSSEADGTRNRPFTKLSQLDQGSLATRFARLYVKGTLVVPHGETVLSVNCEIKGGPDAHLLIPSDASFVLRTVSLVVDDCILSRDAPSSGAESSIHLFDLDHSVLDLNRCDLAAVFGNSGTVFSGMSSVINLDNSSIVSQADVYTAAFSVANTRIRVKESHISAIAPTAVGFSLKGGHLEVRSSSCKVVGAMGRIAELLGGDCILIGNTFTGELENRIAVVPVWKDASVVTLDESANIVQGF